MRREIDAEVEDSIVEIRHRSGRNRQPLKNIMSHLALPNRVVLKLTVYNYESVSLAGKLSSSL